MHKLFQMRLIRFIFLYTIIIIIIIIIILEEIDSINLRHRQCPLLPPWLSQEFFNVSNFSAQLLAAQNIPNYTSHIEINIVRSVTHANK